MLKTRFLITGLAVCSSILALSVTVLFANDFVPLKANNEVVWYHYEKIDPNENAHGSKEFWANANDGCQSYVLEEPSEGQIIDRDFSTNPFFASLSYLDDRYIPSIFEVNNAVYPISNGIDFIYGIYPQTVVNDVALLEELEALDQSSIDIRNGWYLYEGRYYTHIITNPVTNDVRYHNNNVIPSGEKNWFICEPIWWTTLEDDNGDKFLLANQILDVQRFDVESNFYMTSDIRSWLNNDFYNSAFALGNQYIKPTLVNDNFDPDHPSDKDYNKVFLPSYQNYTNQAYGFNPSNSAKDNARLGKTTDYVRASFCNLRDNFGAYFTRTPTPSTSNSAYIINDEGQIYGLTVADDRTGARPAITINFAIN